MYDTPSMCGQLMFNKFVEANVMVRDALGFTLSSHSSDPFALVDLWSMVDSCMFQ